MGFHSKKFKFNQARKDKQRKAMFYYMNNSTTRTRKKSRPKIDFEGKGKHPKRFSNNVKTISNSNDIKVLNSENAKEGRRNFQNHVVSIKDEDSNIQMLVIDRQNALKPKKADYVTTQVIQGDFVVTEYDKEKRKVAELHIQPSNIRAVDTVKPKSQVEKRVDEFNQDIHNPEISNNKIAEFYDQTFIRTVANDEFGLKRDSDTKNERLNLVRKIRKKQGITPFTEKEKQKTETPKFGDVTKIKR